MDWKDYKVAAISCITTITLLSLYQRWQRKSEIRKLKQETQVDWETIQRQPLIDRKEEFQSKEYQDLVQEQLSRNALFLGEEGIKAVRGAFVVVIGLGGVGSHCVRYYLELI